MKKVLSFIAVICLLFSWCLVLVSCDMLDNYSWYNSSFDASHEYDVTEWRELLSIYEKNWKEYWIASDKYDADPSNTAKREKRDNLSAKLVNISEQLLNIQFELAEKAESGSEEDVKEFQEFLDELERINREVVYRQS